MESTFGVNAAASAQPNAQANAQRRFRLQPPRPWACYLMMAFGLVLVALPFLYGVTGTPKTAYLISGFGTVVFTALYLASPIWRTAVELTSDGLVVAAPSGKRRWATDFQTLSRVLVDEEEQAMLLFAQNGSTFLLPSPAHKAPYRIREQPALFALLLGRIPPALISHTKVFS